MKLSLEWTKGLSDKDTTALSESFNTSYHLFEQLQGLIDVKLLALTKERTDRKTFESPAWGEYQAYLIGQEKALLDLKTLITLRE